MAKREDSFHRSENRGRVNGPANRDIRFEKAAKALKKAIERNRLGHPIIVEGLKDVRCLKTLGFLGKIETINRGWDRSKLIANLYEKYGDFDSGDGGAPMILLMDWDRTGGKLQTSIRNRLESMDVKIDESLRTCLIKVMKPEGRTVESLEPHAKSLLEKINSLQA